MIFRALLLFAIAAIAIPHEPDLGLGRPDAALPGAVASWLQSAMPKAPCGAPDNPCLSAASAGALQDFTLERLHALKGEIAAARRARQSSGD